jgi:AAA ATPase-like protein
MHISTLSLRRFRAFDQQVAMPLSSFTVLTGPNNLGKSTILRALALFFAALQRGRSSALPNRDYRYEEDYPKHYFGRRGRRWPTRVAVDIELEPEDQRAIEQEAQVGVPETFGVSVEVVPRRGLLTRFSFELDLPLQVEETARLLHWLGQNLRYVYVPANRDTDQLRRSVFPELLGGAIDGVRRSRQRIEGLQQFYSDVLTQLRNVETTLVDELHKYLPDVQTIRFDIGDLDLLRLVNIRDLRIDDGANTSIEQKGDGFKSLFVISLLQYMARQRYGKNLVFGIEEPETHLHSSAVYEIKSALRELSKSFQVVISTHSPILIQRDSLAGNIIVERARGVDFTSSARPARQLGEVRRSLGIRPHENMTSAEVVVVVEGLTEENCLGSLLGTLGGHLSQAIREGRIRLISAHGSGNVPAVVRALARDAASAVVLVDSDDAGLVAGAKVKESGLIDVLDVFHVPPRDGCRETEFEDLFPPELWVQEVGDACGIELAPEQFEDARRRTGGRNNRSAKWSLVMEQVCQRGGRDWAGVADAAKTAFGRALAAKADQINRREHEWLANIGVRVDAHLAEADPGPPAQ